MRDTQARRLLVAEARRLALLHQTIAGDIAAAQADSDGRPASDTRGPAAAAVTLEREVEESLRVAIDDERAEVALALARVDAGSFGTCVACGRPIPDDRIESVPAARFCLPCEVAGERGEGGPAMPMIDALLRAALQEVGGWADDGAEEDDVLVLGPEEAAMHRATSDRR